MRRSACALAIAVSLSACTLARRPQVVPQADPAERLAAADAQIRAGCFDCLLSAYHEYDALRTIPAAADAATAGAIRAAALLALRQNELGMANDEYLRIAKGLAGSTAATSGRLAQILDVIDALPRRGVGAARAPTSDVDLEKMRRLRENRDSWSTLLRDAARDDAAAAYTWLAFACDAIDTRDLSRQEIFAAVETFAGAPLVVYRESLCRATEVRTLAQLLTADERFVEVTYSLGQDLVRARKLDDAEQMFQRAYAWHPRWPSLTHTMAGVAMSAEEFDRALQLYEETLALDPRAPDALLGKVRALTYLKRNEDAIAATDELLAERWYLGDARYWRALNETQLTRYDAAWFDIEEAAKTLINAEVPKLAGIIAYRRQQLDVAIRKFTESRERNPLDCETRFYLGVVHAELRQWAETADVLTSAAACLQNAEQDLTREIDELRASNEKPERKARQIAKREQQIADGRRMTATAWFDTAVAYYGLAKRDEARQYAEKVADDQQFGERARELLSRLR
jgi:tetratricopeptide (TPR) repeat protein